MEDVGALLAILTVAFVVAIFFGRPLADWIGTKVGNWFYVPSDDSVDVHPDFSLAEAQVQQGHYEKAIEVFRDYLARFPKELAPHIRIVDLLVEHFNDYAGAIQELKTAISKTSAAETTSLLYQRMADLHLAHHNDIPSAVECLKEIQRRFPHTRHANAALERATQLQKTDEQDGAPAATEE
jgi:tetratricopeptide (TPR) repeat protein